MAGGKYKFKEAGMFYTFGQKEPTKDEIIRNGKKKVSSLTTSNGTYTYSAGLSTTSANYTNNMYAVGYVLCTDGSVFYTDVTTNYDI